MDLLADFLHCDLRYYDKDYFDNDRCGCNCSDNEYCNCLDWPLFR